MMFFWSFSERPKRRPEIDGRRCLAAPGGQKGPRHLNRGVRFGGRSPRAGLARAKNQRIIRFECSEDRKFISETRKFRRFGRSEVHKIRKDRRLWDLTRPGPEAWRIYWGKRILGQILEYVYIYITKMGVYIKSQRPCITPKGLAISQHLSYYIKNGAVISLEDVSFGG